jgi:isochorismate synthase
MQETQVLRQLKTNRKSLFNQVIEIGLPAAMWRLPNEKQVFLAVSKEEIPPLASFQEFNQSSGFAVSAFQNKDKSFFINADFMYQFDENELPVSTLGATFQLSQQDLPTTSGSKRQPFHSKPIIAEETYNASIFEAMVAKAVAAIQAGEMQKVVLSRTKNVVLKESFEIIKAYDELCVLYPTAFVSVVSLPHLNEIWMGASPETLVSQDKNGIFKTMALAGTQSAFDAEQRPLAPSDAAWKQKEIEEQAYVSRYIIDCFKKIRLREFTEQGPKTVKAGGLLHLRTDFIVDTVAVNMPELVELMLQLLHPTSAVCGMPKAPATAFILETEKHHRSFYSGYLGPVNINQATHLFVNLRTMRLQNRQATLFAGCGITENSNPAKEWLETEMKCQTMLKIC